MDGIHLRHGAAPDLPPEYCRAIDGAAIGPCAGSCGTAAFRGERVIVSDIATDPLWENYKGLALGHGLLSCWSEPILCSQGKVLGTFAMYHRHISEPTEEDLQSIRVAAHLAGIAIERERAETARQAAERKREEVERESIARDRIAAAVRRSEERYALAEQATNDGIWDWNPATGEAYLSPQWKAQLGFENDELANQQESFFSRIHPEDMEPVREAVRLHLEENRTYCVKLRLRCKDGGYRWFEARGEAIRDEAGKVIRMVGAMSDITERRQAEDELAKSEQKYRQLFESSRDAIMTIFPPEWKFTSANVATIELFGVKDEQEFIALGPWNLSPERQPDGELSSVAAQRAIATAMERGSHFFEWTHQRLGGAPFFATVLLTRVELGGTAGLQATVRDITERKRAEKELHLVSNRLLLATRAASIGVWDFDPVNDVLIWDEQMFRVFGIARDTFSGTYEAWQATVHPEDLPRELEKVQMALRGEQEYDSEFRVVWPDKSIHHVKANASVFRDASGGAVHMIGTNWDITVQKRAEEELARTVAELARSNADLAQFASVASHDLQEPLRTVVGCTELLEKRYGDKLDAQAGEWIQLTVEGAKRMQTLIRDLLAYSRVGSRGKSFEPTEASAALNLALANLATAIRESGATITHDPLPSLVADQTQLAQLLQNLIGNALKFCKDRRPEIHVGAQPANGSWTFSVRDNGIGIEPQYRARIFEIFQRLHTRAEYPGTGIGLAICQRIVERHGGRIWVESEPGQGSTFYFTIPKNGNHGG